MTVAELMSLLENEDPDTEVVFSYDYGDYHNTDVAQPVKCVELLPCVKSGYHQMLKVLSADEDPDEDAEYFLVLSKEYI